MAYDVVLASASPRRRKLLDEAGVRFRVHAVDVDETLDADMLANPEEAVKKLAERKAHRAVEDILSSDYHGDLVVIGADTMVVLGNEIFGKPADEQQARQMLEALSDATHRVYTGVSLWAVHAPEDEEIGLFYRSIVEHSDVTFRELSADEIDAYIASGEPMDKAGAYGIQAGGETFVAKLSGSLDTVIGLPVERLMKEFGELLL